VRTVPVDLADLPLLDLLPEQDPVSWIRRGEGIVGWGVAARLETSGPARFSDAVKWWSETVARADVDDRVGEPGTGLVSFGAFAFADEPGDSVLVVPQVVVGRRGDRTWLTTVSVDAPVLEPTGTPRAPVGLTFSDGSRNGEEWMTIVAEAVERNTAGDLEKVVLARDLIATTDEPIDVRWPLRRLADQYEMCWTFHVDGLFGATPEMLVRRERGLVTSRVLAGTIRRTGDDERDLALAATLARSSKDLEEHEYAVRSVAEALEPHCSSMNVPEAPFVLHLPNVMHLATDVAGVVHDAGEVSSLQLAEALHPSAAVGGTPTSVASDLISEIEGMDRGRYAGPVGWMDGTGDGEWGIALRSGELSGSTVRLFAGCGIVGDSDPAAELAEAQAKFVPVRDAVSGG
jgi:menaquinone-specific isochorismate synthase